MLRRLLAGCFVLALSSLPLAPRAAAQSVRSGEMAFELAGGASLSYLGVDLVQLEYSLCGIAPMIKDPKLVVANDGGHTGRLFGLDALAATELSGGTTIRVDVIPASLHLASPTPLVTACGGWTYTLTLDAGQVQTPATLTLLRNRPVDVAGAFTGSVTVAALLDFVPQGGGAAQQRFYTLTLDLSGTWALDPTSAGKGGAAPTASNLVLFTQKNGALWVKDPKAAPEHSLEDPNAGQLVLQPADSALDRLNPPSLDH